MDSSGPIVNETEELIESVVNVNRVAKVVKGGRNFRFNAAVVVGDGKGRVSGATGKAAEIADAIRKATSRGRKSLKAVPRLGTTVPHLVWSTYGGARVMLKPAPPGTGIVAGNVVRAVMECAGIGDVVGKCLNSTNPVNVMRATLQALYSMKSPESVRALRDRSHIRAFHEKKALQTTNPVLATEAAGTEEQKSDEA